MFYGKHINFNTINLCIRLYLETNILNKNKNNQLSLFINLIFLLYLTHFSILNLFCVYIRFNSSRKKKEPNCYIFILSCHLVEVYLLMLRYDYFCDNWNNQ